MQRRRAGKCLTTVLTLQRWPVATCLCMEGQSASRPLCLLCSRARFCFWFVGYAAFPVRPCNSHAASEHTHARCAKPRGTNETGPQKVRRWREAAAVRRARMEGLAQVYLKCTIQPLAAISFAALAFAAIAQVSCTCHTVPGSLDFMFH